MAIDSKTVCKITGITQRQIDYWDRIHFIKPSTKEASGYGSVRLFSFTDLVQIKVAKTLIDQGVSLQKIRKAITYLKKNFPDINKPLAEMRLITDGNTIFVLTENKKVIIDTLSKGQMVMSIAVGRIIEELKGEVKKIGQERKYKVRVKGRNYEVILHPDLEDGGFWVECPALPGCASQGDTVEETLMMIKDAIEGHLEVIAEKGNKKRKAA
jgi:predicted RNase H-like HicB family nuclease